MQHVAVESSLLSSIAHDPDSLTMQVLFRRGGLYEYTEVDSDEFEAVLNPSEAHKHSVGVAYGALIKGRKPSRKLDGSNGSNGNGHAPAPVIEMLRSSVADEFNQEPEKPVDDLVAEVQTVSRKSTELTTQATAIQVTNPESQAQASEVLLAIAAMRKEIADTFKPMKDAAYRAHKTVCDQEKMLDTPLAEAERAVKGQIGSYVQEQKRLAAAEEERLRAIERERADAEARELAESQAIDQAIDLEARGDTKAAEAVLANPAPVAPRYVAPAPVAANVAQVKGVSTRLEWDFRITDMNKIPREYLLINETAIRNAGKNTKGRIQIAGVEFFEKTVVAASRRG